MLYWMRFLSLSLAFGSIGLTASNMPIWACLAAVLALTLTVDQFWFAVRKEGFFFTMFGPREMWRLICESGRFSLRGFHLLSATAHVSLVVCVAGITILNTLPPAFSMVEPLVRPWVEKSPFIAGLF
ncbi:MAG: hypothetical protein WCV86_01980 [Patescibacteria group bacterium]|jgi:hypothetical protein